MKPLYSLLIVGGTLVGVVLFVVLMSLAAHQCAQRGGVYALTWPPVGACVEERKQWLGED